MPRHPEPKRSNILVSPWLVCSGVFEGLRQELTVIIMWYDVCQSWGNFIGFGMQSRPVGVPYLALLGSAITCATFVCVSWEG